ncbi:extracellular solute-binding protein [Paenibacillus sp. Marseille-Q4541]|uniref:extracellular solute-binding protein n=1 Tax=Paenibacillus sp. Marseille-Q4541 TaxID=2831522 RepID=UPI001BA84027|nr:extracellular solute-binding protein [Paenibacillus sp. Marseille-Q4541]
MKKIALSMSCFLLVTSLLAGCGKSESSVKNEDPNAPATYTMSTTDTKLKWGTPVDKSITDKTGVSVEYLPIVGDEAQKMDLWLASGDYPDMLTLSPNMTGKYRDADALIPLEDLIDEYGPNIKKRFGKYYDLLRDEDGHIYSLYGINLSQEPPASAAASFIIQYDVLKESGYPEVKTFDQLFDIIEAYYKKHPTIEGQPTIPFSGYWGGYTFTNPVIAAAGLPDQGWSIVDENNNVRFGLTEPFAKEYYKFLNRLQKAGMLDKNIFGKGEENLSKIAQGRVLAEFMPGWLLNTPEKSIVAAGLTERQYAKFPILIDENTVDQSFMMAITNSSSNWAITNTAKNPERIVQMIDFLFSDEGQLLINWGVEGLQYEVKDGKRVKKADYVDQLKKNPDLVYQNGPAGPMTNFTIGDGALLDDGDYATSNTKESVIANYDEATKEVLSKYGKETWSDFLPSEPIRVPSMLWQLSEPEESKAIFIKLEETLNKEVPKMILAKTDAEFDAAWDNFVDQVNKAGRKQYDEVWTKTWNEFLDRFNAAIGS